MKTLIKEAYAEHLLKLEKSLKDLQKKLTVRPKRFPLADNTVGEVIGEALLLMIGHKAITEEFIKVCKSDRAEVRVRSLMQKLTPAEQKDLVLCLQSWGWDKDFNERLDAELAKEL